MNIDSSCCRPTLQKKTYATLFEIHGRIAFADTHNHAGIYRPYAPKVILIVFDLLTLTFGFSTPKA